MADSQNTVALPDPLDDQDVRRAEQVRKSLRPDFYEWWPRFTSRELTSRLSQLSFEDATHLTQHNIQLAARLDPKSTRVWWSKYLQHTEQERRAISAKLLSRVGVSDDVCRAFLSIDRSSFFPTELQKYAYLNVSIWLNLDTNVTMFGLQAMVCDMLRQVNPARIVEVGYGTGAQSALIRAQIPAVSYWGFEPNLNLLQPLETNASGECLKVFGDFFDLEVFELKEDDLIIFSCSLDHAGEKQLTERIRSANCHALYAAPSPEQVFQEVLLGRIRWNDKIISSFEEYRDNPRSYQTIKLSRSKDGVVKELGRVHNAGYVSYRVNELAERSLTNPAIERLNSLL